MFATDPASIDPQILRQIEQSNQQQVLQFWNELSEDEQTRLARQLSHIDWNLIADYQASLDSPETHQLIDSERVTPPAHVVRTPRTESDKAKWQRAREVGEEAIRSGKVAALLLAGGQGTRLGFEHPKGMFPIGPVSGNSLFQLLAEQAVALTERYQSLIPYLIMTSEGTHDETVAFFESHQFFGLNRDNLHFFQQGYSPCVDSQSGKLLLAEKGSLRMNPDGHGGLLAALLRAGLFDDLGNLGVEYLFTHQIDNPLARVCDPAFVGLHIMHDSEVSTKVVAKTGPEEKVGVAVDLDGRTAIIEYSDLPSDLANALEATGELRFWAGSTAIHLFNVAFMDRVARTSRNLPWHRAIKKIPYVDDQGQSVSPDFENGVKFERFLFDTLPLATTALIVETLRADEFAPLKNRSGDYSPDYVRNQMTQLMVRWLHEAGINVPDRACIEISPRYAMSSADLRAKANELVNLSFEQPIHLT